MKLELYGSDDVARGKYNNTEVEAIRGIFCKKESQQKLRNNSMLMTPTTVSDFGKP
jgi:hypothetical protein